MKPKDFGCCTILEYCVLWMMKSCYLGGRVDVAGGRLPVLFTREGSPGRQCGVGAGLQPVRTFKMRGARCPTAILTHENHCSDGNSAQSGIRRIWFRTGLGGSWFCLCWLMASGVKSAVCNQECMSIFMENAMGISLENSDRMSVETGYEASFC
jgi:hypothetical protein